MSGDKATRARPVLDPLTPAERRALARDIYRGRLFMPAKESELVAFNMVLGLMDPADVPANAAMVVGDLSAAIPGRAVNGLPIFTAAQFLTQEDLEAVVVDLIRITALVESGDA